MATSSSHKKGTIKLPVQTLNWSLIKKTANLKKIIFQFYVKLSGNTKVFNLVAYPAYRVNGKWKFGKRVLMPIQYRTPLHELKLPFTLGNLDLKIKKSNKLLFSKNTKLTFTPYLYTKNDHAAYTVSDGTNLINLFANPCPPGKPAEEQ